MQRITYQKSMQSVDETIYHYLMESDTKKPIWTDKTGGRILSIVDIIKRFQEVLMWDKNVMDMTLLAYHDQATMDKSQALGSFLNLLTYAQKNMCERWWKVHRLEFLQSIHAFFENHGFKQDGSIVIYSLV